MKVHLQTTKGIRSMKTRVFAVSFLILLAAVCSFGQSDNSSSPNTRPFQMRDTFPGVCKLGEFLYYTGTNPGALYKCDPANTWVLQASGGGGGGASSAGQLTDFNVSIKPGTGSTAVNWLPSNAGFGNITYTLANTCVATLTGTPTGTAWFYIDAVSHRRTVASSATITTDANCDAVGIEHRELRCANLLLDLLFWNVDTNGGTDLRSVYRSLVVKGVKWLNTSFVAGDIVIDVDPTIVGRRTACMVAGADNGSALADADIGPQGGQKLVPAAATVLEVWVKADAGTPSFLPRKEVAGVNTSLLSSALSTAASGAQACANTGGTVSFVDGSTTCTNTLTVTALPAGSWLGVASGTAGGTAKRGAVCVVFTLTN